MHDLVALLVVLAPFLKAIIPARHRSGEGVAHPYDRRPFRGVLACSCPIFGHLGPLVGVLTGRWEGVAMTLRHEQGALRPAVLPPDELPKVVAVAEAVPSGPIARTPSGHPATPEAARELGRRGGLARARRDAQRWGAKLGLGRLLHESDLPFADDATVRPFVREAEAWSEAQLAHLLATFGFVSPGVASVVNTSAWETCFSRVLFDLCTKRTPFWRFTKDDHGEVAVPRFDLITTAQRLADSARQNLLAAHELCAREAEARAKTPPPNPPWMVPDDEDDEDDGQSMVGAAANEPREDDE